MGRLRTLTVLLTLSAWGAPTDGASPDDGTAPPAASTTRPDPPASPSKYVEAGVFLFEQKQDYNLAAQYFKAAQDYRDQLTPAEQAKVDAYIARLPQAQPAAAPVLDPGPAPVVQPVDPAVTTADTTAADPAASAPAVEPIVRAQPAKGDKQAARWLLQQAREMLSQGRFDEAEQKVSEARSMQVRWGLFDDTPDRVTAAIAKARPAATATAGTDPRNHDRPEAKNRLREARAALSAGQLDQAEAIALEVSSWGLRYGMFEDNPEKVVEAVRVVRRRDAVRQSGVEGAVQDLYAVAVQEARQALTAGQLDVAEQKARKALDMNVAPPLNADRAEAVLNDIAATRAGQAAPAQALATVAPAPVDATVQPVQAEALPAGEPTTLALEPAGTEAPAPVADGLEVMPVPAAEATTELPPADVPQAVPTTEMPAAEPAVVAEAPVGEPAAVDTGAPVSPGEGLLIQARALLTSGNYSAARQVAEQAKAGGFGVETQADELLNQIALSAQGSSVKLYEAALDALRKGDHDRARALLTEVAASDNPDDGLAQKVQDLLARLPGEQAGKATLEAVDDVETVKAQKLNVEVGTKVAEARRMLETDPEKAIGLLEETLKAVKASDVNATAQRTMVRRVEVAIELAKKEKSSFDEKMKDVKYRAEIEQKRLRILEADKAKKAQLTELMTKATEAEAQGDYAKAEQFARMAAEVDPNNVAAVALSTKARWQRRYERDVEIRTDMDESTVQAFQAVDAAGIVPTDVQERSISYPKSFADLTRSRRELASRLGPKKDQKVLATESKLRESITINMEAEQSLQGTVDFLQNYTGLNIVLDPSALAEEGLTPNTPISQLKVKDVSIKQALDLILKPLNLTYVIRENVVLITSPQASRSQTFPVAYPVADLIISPHRRGHNANGIPGSNGAPGAPGQSLDGSLNQVPFPGENQAGLGLAPAQAPTGTGSGQLTTQGSIPQVSDSDFEPLVQLIKASVAPGTWQDGPESAYNMGGFGLGGGAGGGADGGLGTGTEQAIGSITPFFLNISLIVRHTSEVHDEIVDLLRQLRRLQDLQISVEVRFITVSDSFFEEIGVDFDFAIQSDVVGKKSSFAIPNPAAVPTAPGGTGTAAVAPYLINPARDHAYGARQPLVVGTNAPTNDVNSPQFNPNLMIPFVQDSISAITPFNALTSNTGATFGLAFLSDLEVYFFMRAVQGDTRSNLVQAPKVTTFNGAPASVFSTTQQNYVQALTPVVGAGAVAFQPSIGSFADGVQLLVTPVVSADRRYVRMTMAPIFQTLQGFDTFTIPAAVGGGGLGGGATSINGQVQLPRFTLNQVNTTVTVPDGGTVLLGGVKRLREERREFGVPILSKTPLINRLFRNIGIGRTTDSLMLMVTPRIIILEEEEERLGIPPVQQETF